MNERPTDPSGQVSVLVVKDVVASVGYYTRVFGFDEDFVYGEPPTFAGVCRGPVSIHLQASTMTHRPVGGGCISLFVRDAYAAHAAVVERGGQVTVPPARRDYGLIDFITEDPDGNQIVFGSDSQSSEGDSTE